MEESHGVAVVLVAMLGLAMASSLTTTAAVDLHPSQAAVLAACQEQWAAALQGWAAGGDCAAVYGVECDAAGMITYMHVAEQSLDGPLPDVIGNLTALTYLRLATTNLAGSIPPSFSRLALLHLLDLSYNRGITGSIPDALSSLTNLNALGLSYMDLTGSFPSWVSGHTTLDYISLVGNRLSGAIPESLGSAISLNIFSVWQNQFSGSIPESIGSLTKLTSMDLFSNRFTGSIPQGIGNMEGITSLNVANNSLTGHIATTLSRLSRLQILDLGYNRLEGSLPSWITGMPNLTHLDVSHNKFTGLLPAGLGGLQQLTFLDVSSTSLICPADASTCVVSQSPNSSFCRLCPSFCSTCSNPAGGAAAAAPPPPTASSTADQSGLATAAIIGIVAAALLLLLLLLAAAWWSLTRSRRTKPATAASPRAEGAPSSTTACQQFPLDAVTRATSDWATANLLGAGSFGDVYKGVSPLDGRTLCAVKRAKVITSDFKREVAQMATKHHPNLVRLLGFAVGGDVHTRVENVLVYEFVAKGDLEHWMGSDAPTPLTLQQRLDILVGAARGVEYLHSFGIVHRDIKPANILLDAHMQPKVADFGLVRGGEGTTMGSTRVMGTVGYVDPAYTRTHTTTTATDLYSFGVLMLTVLSGRAAVITEAKEGDGPGHVHEDREPTTIIQWASELLAAEKAWSVGDARMAAPEAIITHIAQLAISCTAMPTASRPSMSQVAQHLEAMRAELGGGVASASGAEIVDSMIESDKLERTIDEDLELLNAQFP